MKDSELIDLIRQGASGWSGPSRSAAAAKYSLAGGPRRWRFLAISAATVGAVLLFGLSLSGNRTTVVQAILSAVDGQKASQAEPTPTSQTEPSPSPTIEPVVQPKQEPTPPPASEPSPVPKHEPTPSPEPVHSPAPPEASPTPASK